MSTDHEANDTSTGQHPTPGMPEHEGVLTVPSNSGAGTAVDETVPASDRPNLDDSQASAADRVDEDDKESDDEGEDLQIHAVRKARTREERKARKGGKAGNPGRFRTDIQDFLSGYVDVYMSIGKGKKGKNKELDDFWHMIQSKFWEQYTGEDARVGMPQNGAGVSHQVIVEETNDVSSITEG